MKNKAVNIKEFLKKDKDLVIGIDGVEYLINSESIETIERGDKKIPLIRLYDNQIYIAKLMEIENSLFRKGLVDYLDKKS